MESKMNQRIQELAKQAQKYASENRSGSFVKYDHEWFVLYNEKFAELMIAEFSDVVKQTANEITTAGFKGDATQDEVMLCVNGALSVLDNIRKRFGVE